jgi:Na+-transporting methylmalonyl-CoA/oxaloacetate decarboxylase gamma subunit
MWSVLGEGAKFSLIAQSMVFLVLFLLAVVIVILKFIFYRPGKAAERREPSGPAEAAPLDAEENLEVAAIAAALEMHRRGGGAAEAPAIVGQEGPWAAREPHSRPETLQGKSRRWSHG